jgi:hypothetical protein
MADGRRWYENAGTAEQRRRFARFHDTGLNLDRKYWVALVLYAGLAVLSWFTLDGRISVGGRLVELRLIPLVIIGAFALRTMVAMKAEKIRREGEKSH